jgi:hypothetical protein
MRADRAESQFEADYDQLLASIEASKGTFSLFIAVCDDWGLQSRLIMDYEAEITPNLIPYRVVLSPSQVSLWAAIDELAETDIYLRHGVSAVFTITGIETLDPSERESCFEYLEWTQVRLQKLNHPIVFWVDAASLPELMTKSEAFWSIRRDFFRFTLEPGLNRSDTTLAEFAGVEISIEEIERIYRGYWVRVEVTEEQNGSPTAGKVILYSRNDADLVNRIKRRPGHFYTFFCGSVDVDLNSSVNV